MSKRQQTILMALVGSPIILTSALAYAAGGGDHHGFPWGSFITSWVNFLIFAGLLYYFAGSKISAYFQDRSERIGEEINKAQHAREEAEERLSMYEERLEAFDKERQELLDEYAKQGEREKEKMLEEAERMIEKMRKDAERMIEQEKRRAIASIERQAVELAVTMATKMATEKLDERGQRKLVEGFVEDIEKAA